MTATSNQSSPVKAQILTVQELLLDNSLNIPLYQRPYKWNVKNVNQLFKDIATHKDKSSYRLGTIVFHQENGRNNIVDGQQRIITLLLTIRALSERRENNLEDKKLKEKTKERLSSLASNMITPRFQSKISKDNIRNNYLEICRIVERADFTEEHIDFLLNRCEVVTFYLDDISEAFQFFDSQNTRGRDLEPHDLLKAYHLREFSANDEPLKATTVEQWENSEAEALSELFSQYLYRIRNWSKGVSARYFSKEHIGLFKGVNIEAVNYPYTEQLRIIHHHKGQNDGQSPPFPFQLTQTIINGRRFFEMVAHYQTMVSDYKNNRLAFMTEDKLDGDAKEILETINTYDGCKRTGDRYVRMLFDCLLIHYIDKFGDAEISRAIEKIFIYSFSRRLSMQAVQLASVDNHVLNLNLFRVIEEAVTPSDFIHYTLHPIQENYSSRTKKIENLFRKMKYLVEK